MQIGLLCIIYVAIIISYKADELIDNLTKIGSSNNFNLIVLKDGDKIGDSRLYYIKENGLINLSEQYNWPTELNMGNANTLKNFLSLIRDNYPANHYALIILSEHGSSCQGVCCDQDSWNDFSIISIPEFAEVLKDITYNGSEKIDIIGFMPCITGMIEVAYEIAPYTRYMIASEEHMLEELDKGREYNMEVCKDNLGFEE